MGIQKNATYKVHNGIDFDEIHFKTNEAMVTGAVQNISVNGYRKFPDGLLIQWGSYKIPSGDFNGITGAMIALPLKYPNAILNAQVTLSHSTEAEKYIVNDLDLAGDASYTSQIAIRYKHTGNFLYGGIKCDYFCIGY